MSISPTGYEYGMTPRGNHPFWDNTGDITGVTASVTVDDTSGVPDAEVDAEYNEGVVNLAFAFTGLKGAKGDKGDTGAVGATGATGAKGDTGSTPNVTAAATVDSTSGTPSVEVTKTGTTDNPVLNFAFSNLKGDAGTDGSTPNVTATATVDGTSGTPDVTVTKSGTESAPVFNFAFEGLKGAKGNTGDTPNVTATASVDNNTGTPSVSVTTTGTTDNPVLNFAFSNLKGATGAQGAQGVKGETGDTGAQGAQGLTGATPVISATATVDNTSGAPAVSVTKSGTDEAPNLAFAFTGLKGATGGTQTTLHGFWIDPDTQEPIYSKSGALTRLEITENQSLMGVATITEEIPDGSTQSYTMRSLPWWDNSSTPDTIPRIQSISETTKIVGWSHIADIMTPLWGSSLSAADLYKCMNDPYYGEFSMVFSLSKTETGLSEFFNLVILNSSTGTVDSATMTCDTYATDVFMVGLNMKKVGAPYNSLRSSNRLEQTNKTATIICYDTQNNTRIEFKAKIEIMFTYDDTNKVVTDIAISLGCDAGTPVRYIDSNGNATIGFMLYYHSHNVSVTPSELTIMFGWGVSR